MALEDQPPRSLPRLPLLLQRFLEENDVCSLAARLQGPVWELERSSTWPESAPDGLHGWLCGWKTGASGAKVAGSLGLSFCGEKKRKSLLAQFAEAALISASCLKKKKKMPKIGRGEASGQRRASQKNDC